VEPAVALYWIPLGAGGNGFVRWNGRVYELMAARRERRSRCHLFHTALEVTVDDVRYVIENAWPSPDGDTRSRGVVMEGPVWSTRLMRWRPFRYEVRRWPDGTIADRGFAVGGPQLLTNDGSTAQCLLDSVERIPPMVWGRRPDGGTEMWNSNSVISWLLARTGFDLELIGPPSGGRAPGWVTGIELAVRAP
jgi:hypothetical protein